MKEVKTLFAVILLYFFFSCQKDPLTSLAKIEYEEIDLECIRKASGGGSFSFKVDSSQEYDSLYNQLYTQPLEDWLSNNYDGLIDGVIKNYPDAQPSQYDSILLNDYIYNFAPYLFVKDCKHPEVDFNIYTLLGQSANVGGCSSPSLESEICVDNENRQIIFTSLIETYGSCLKGFAVQNWILLEKLESDYEVIFLVEESNL